MRRLARNSMTIFSMLQFDQSAKVMLVGFMVKQSEILHMKSYFAKAFSRMALIQRRYRKYMEIRGWRLVVLKDLFEREKETMIQACSSKRKVTKAKAASNKKLSEEL